MARFVPIAILVASLPGPALAQSQSANLAPKPMVIEEQQPEPSFDIPDDLSDSANLRPAGSWIVAGTEMVPNTMIGIGIFGEKVERAAQARATVRDFTLPKTRKPAVGFSLKF